MSDIILLDGGIGQEIVARAGVSKPVLYYYFQSKEGLYYAILKWGAEVQKKIIDDVFEVSGTVQDRINFLYRRIYEEIQEYQGLYTMIHGLIYGPPRGAPEYDFPIYHRQMFDAVKQICFEFFIFLESSLFTIMSSVFNYRLMD